MWRAASTFSRAIGCHCPGPNHASSRLGSNFSHLRWLTTAMLSLSALLSASSSLPLNRTITTSIESALNLSTSQSTTTCPSNSFFHYLQKISISTSSCSARSPESSIAMQNNSDISYIDSQTAQAIDSTLMSPPDGFSIDQLMELAGLCVASATHDYFLKLQSSSMRNKDIDTINDVKKIGKIVVLCGPGNNGGDGLVAARHLKHFGHEKVTVIYPKQNKGDLFTRLVKECRDLDIEIKQTITYDDLLHFDLVVDALLGFSFKGPLREPFASLIQLLTENQSSIPVISVDIPSGWEVDTASNKSSFMPGSVVSLTLPKLCMKHYKGVHYIGGRFIPPSIATLYNVTLPNYGIGSHQFILLNSDQTRNT